MLTSRPIDPDESLLTIGGLVAGYGKKAVLRDVTLDVRSGQAIGLVGANGAGKTTLLQTIAGRLPPLQYDTFLVLGRETGRMSSKDRVREGISYVPQGAHVFPSLTIAECLVTACHAAAVDTSEGVSSAFQMFPKLEQRSAQRAGTLSGGERQMLAVSMAMMRKPRLLLLDEPSIGLAPSLVHEIITKVIDFRQEFATAVIIAEQNIGSILRLVNELFVLRTGVVEAPLAVDPTMSQETMFSLLV